jgi:hemoglobin/transferrin/lactoferrin receptor protein
MVLGTSVWLLALLVGGATLARAEDGADAALEPPPLPPVAVPDSQALPPVVVRPPRIEAGPRDVGPVTTVTPLRREAEAFDVPGAVTVLRRDELRLRRAVRGVPDALMRLPGVMVQKTAPLQASPFIRGFTGYNNLFLVDGIRLNHSAMRAGPNQYWSTVDAYTIERLEVARGPHSVLYGSDAVGGTVNAIPWRRTSFAPGVHLGGGLSARVASAERSVFLRGQFEGNADRFGWAGGVTWKYYGDIESGGGELPGTGDITEFDADLRFDVLLSRCWRLAVAYQHVDQDDAPRTETTVDSVPFRGTVAGGELRRDFDQQRDLVYARATFDGGRRRLPIQRASVTVSYQRTDEERNRLRTGDRRDIQGFTVDQYGAQVQLQSPTRLGTFTYGIDYYHDAVDSFRNDFVGGALTLSSIQGPVGDDATYDLLGVYVEDQIPAGCFEIIPALRFTYAAADADRVDNPVVPGSDPTTPGNIIQVSDEWTSLVGSLKARYHAGRYWNVYANVSQAFRAPTLSDLTALDSTSVVETPAPGLDAEDYVSFEVGAKTERPNFSAGGAVWYTLLEDTIIRSPTGVVIAGTPEVRKDNIGDGWVWGLEAEAAWRFRPAWTIFGNLGWMDAEVDEFDAATGALVSSPLSRMMPFAYMAGLRFEPPTGCVWAQAELWGQAREDRLSLRDQGDVRRIPPDGTPAWAIVNLRAGVRIGRATNVSLAVENLLDENYRIHGSGQNEPGINVVLVLDVDL